MIPSLEPFRSPRRWAIFLGVTGALALIAWALPTRPVEGVDPGAWTSILPPVLAVAAAIAFRQLVLALVLAVVLGSFLAFGPSPVAALGSGTSTFLLDNVTDGFNLRIIAFTLILVGAVHVMARAGGHAGIVAFVQARARSARSTRTSTGLLGLLFFFDDYANSVVVGTTMRPLTDRMRISREKLAFLVDSTAAPVAGLALVSTWIAFEVGLLQDLVAGPPLHMDGYSAFVASLPFRFYCFTALLFVFTSSLSGRDFGPMRRAEERALRTGAVAAPDARPLAPVDDRHAGPAPGIEPAARNTLVPLAVLLTLVIGGMLIQGRGALEDAAIAFSLLDPAVWRLTFGAADSSVVLLHASIGGLLTAMALAVLHGLPPSAALAAFGRGVRTMGLAIVILVLAWAIKGVCDELQTAGWLIAITGGELPLVWLPLITFALAAVTAFATGTSWGTMGILLPVVVPLALALGAHSGPSLFLLFMTIAAVLDGAIFGDHCSPISDTTVLSSIASGCDHIDHVRTQAPYALAAMALAALIGYTGVAMGLPPLYSLPLLLGATMALFLLLGRPLPEHASSDDGERSP
ncbi:MAG: Na+/H+ antiporter NhaC family protein [Deltaproteobacteria bacterium]|nr:MAG: Na+/H+ antiporter NhaC family protein [Deltaproteobacteria bacterium]